MLAIDASFWEGTGAHLAAERPTLPSGVASSAAVGPADLRSLHERHQRKLLVSSLGADPLLLFLFGFLPIIREGDSQQWSVQIHTCRTSKSYFPPRLR